MVSSTGDLTDAATRGLWGYTTHRMWMDACRLALQADFVGHEIFFVVADRNVVGQDSRQFAAKHYPRVELRDELNGTQGFFDCGNAKRILGWSGHDG